MSSSRPYTAILVCGKSVKIEDVMAPLKGDEARTAVETLYPGFTLVALVPGIHGNRCHAYSQDSSATSASQRVDPFDMTYLRNKAI
jgi:hypothetical protein